MHMVAARLGCERFMVRAGLLLFFFSLCEIKSGSGMGTAIIMPDN